jgi:hypothetical protein
MPQTLRFYMDDSGTRKPNHPDTRSRFMEDIGEFLTSIPVIGLACTIDRPGYDWRYREK